MSETEKILAMQEASDYLARVWKRISAPVSYARVTSVDGVPVRVTVDYDDAEARERARQLVGDGDERQE